MVREDLFGLKVTEVAQKDRYETHRRMKGFRALNFAYAETGRPSLALLYERLRQADAEALRHGQVVYVTLQSRAVDDPSDARYFTMGQTFSSMPNVEAMAGQLARLYFKPVRGSDGYHQDHDQALVINSFQITIREYAPAAEQSKFLSDALVKFFARFNIEITQNVTEDDCVAQTNKWVEEEHELHQLPQFNKRNEWAVLAGVLQVFASHESGARDIRIKDAVKSCTPLSLNTYVVKKHAFQILSERDENNEPVFHRFAVKSLDNVLVARVCSRFYINEVGKGFVEIKKQFIFLKQFASTPKQKVDPALKQLVCFYDFETVFDARQFNQLAVYSVAYVVASVSALNSETHEQPDEILDVGFAYCDLRENPDACCEFLLRQTLQRGRDDVVYHFAGFNNDRFDNILLADYAARHDLLNNVMIANGGVSQLQLRGGGRSFDVCKIVMSSLAKACQGFKIEMAKKTLDHTEVQRHFMREGNLFGKFGPSVEVACRFGDWQEVLKQERFDSCRELFEYNVFDCAALFELSVKLFKELRNSIGRHLHEIDEDACACAEGKVDANHTAYLDFTKIKTIGGIAYTFI